jgi:hypothetical protein
VVNKDENKTFGAVFRTPVGDSTGIPHILEHSVLCGSRWAGDTEGPSKGFVHTWSYSRWHDAAMVATTCHGLPAGVAAAAPGSAVRCTSLVGVGVQQPASAAVQHCGFALHLLHGTCLLACVVLRKGD